MLLVTQLLFQPLSFFHFLVVIFGKLIGMSDSEFLVKLVKSLFSLGLTSLTGVSLVLVFTSRPQAGPHRPDRGRDASGRARRHSDSGVHSDKVMPCNPKVTAAL